MSLSIMKDALFKPLNLIGSKLKLKPVVLEEKVDDVRDGWLVRVDAARDTHNYKILRIERNV